MSGPYSRYQRADYQPQSYRNNATADWYPADQRNQLVPYSRPQSAGPSRAYYDSRYSNDRDDRHSRDQDSQRRDRRSQRKRSESPSGLQKHFDTSSHAMGSAALGAFAGGLIGSEVAGNEHRKALAAVAGIVLGGLGASAWEARMGRIASTRNPDRGRDSSPDKESSRRTRSQGNDNGGARGQPARSGNDSSRGGNGGSGNGQDEYDYISDDSGLDEHGRNALERAKKRKKVRERQEREKKEEAEEYGPRPWKDYFMEDLN